MRSARSSSAFGRLATLSSLAMLAIACGVDTEGVGVDPSAAGGGNGGRAGASSDGGGPGKGGSSGAAGKAGGPQGGAGGKVGAGAAGKGGAGDGGTGGAGGGNAGKGGASGTGGNAGAGATVGGGAGGEGGQAGKSGASGNAGTSSGGSAGSTSAGASGNAGTGTVGGNGGAAGNAGATSAGNAGATSAGNAGATSAGNGGIGGSTSAGNGGAAGKAGAGGSTAGAGGNGGASGAGPAGNGGAGGAPPTPICGDGRVNRPEEECDDGNAVDDDACTNACLVRCPVPAIGVPDGGLKNPETDRCYFTSESGQTNAPGPTGNACTGPGVHIALITDSRDLSWIASGESFPGYRAWVGARRDGNIPFGPNAFLWQEGGLVTGTLWAPGEPNPPQDQCVTLRGVDVDNGSTTDPLRYRFSTSPCARLVDSPLPTLCVREPTCRIGGLDGVVGVGGHCYLASPNTLPSFAAAKGYCEQLGGHLATFETPNELRFLGGVGFQNVWIGATQTVPANGGPTLGWRWSQGPTGILPVASELWNVGEPNDGTGPVVDGGAEDCATLINGTRRLNDAPCGQTINRALCEFE